MFNTKKLVLTQNEFIRDKIKFAIVSSLIYKRSEVKWETFVNND